MNEGLQDYLADGPAIANGDYAGLQRLALQDLLRLSAEQVGPVESLIESQYEAARKDVEGQFQGDQRELEVNFRPQSDQIERRHQTETKTIVTHFNVQVQSLNAQAEQKRQETMRLFAERHHRALQQHKDQVMEAEFLVEGVLEKAKQKRRLAQSAVQADRRRLDGLRQEADALLGLYRQEVPAWDDPQPETDPSQARPGRVRRAQEASAQERLQAMQHLMSARVFTHLWPVVITSAVTVAVLAGLALLYGLGPAGLPSLWLTGPVAVLVTWAGLGLAGWSLWKRSRRQIRREYKAFQSALVRAVAALEQQHSEAQRRMEQRFGNLLDQGKAELRRVRQAFEASESQILKQRQTALAAIEQGHKESTDRLIHRRDADLKEAQRQYEQDRSKLDAWIKEERTDLLQRRDQAMAKAEQDHRQALQALHDRWDKAFSRIDLMLKATADLDVRATGDLDGLEEPLASASRTPAVVRYGCWQVDLAALAPAVRAYAGPWPSGRKAIDLPSVLTLPGRGSLLIQHQREGRSAAIEGLRAVMVRLFAALPPGRARFTLVDPVGLGESFAGFMHAGDYRESLVGGRIWTEVAEIQQQLEDLTNHMEDVIQKYLRNEFETIEQYNQQAGPLAEPYRFLVVADFPSHFNEESARRLASIVHSGPRCGVHTLIAYDSRQDLPAGLDLKDLAAAGVYLVHEPGPASASRFVCQEPAMRPFHLVLDRPPSEKVLTRIMHVRGQGQPGCSPRGGALREHRARPSHRPGHSTAATT